MKYKYSSNRSGAFIAFFPNPSRAIKWVLVPTLFFFSCKLDDPMMYRCRAPATLLFFLLTAILALGSLRALKSRGEGLVKKFEQVLFLCLMVSAIVSMSYDAVVFQYKKHVVLAAPESLLNRLGRHFIVGYRTREEILPLLEKGAVGGVFLTARNIRDKTFDEVRQELRSFRSMALKKGGEPIYIAADQEGGKVSRLSPLLTPLPPLSSVIGSTPVDRRIEEKIKVYAAIQGRQLADLGVNLNLSPVVDLKTARPGHKFNVRSRIDQRAISDDADTVTQVAGIYCSTLLEYGVRPTLKHFPGLGSVAEDTHFRTGTLGAGRQFLEQNDWRPFKEIIARTNPFIMLGHVCVPAVDPVYPASLSSAIINEVIRNDWKFDGVLITDDFNMRAVSGRKEGIGKSAVRAVNAGADLILLSYDGSQYYPVMYEMIKAYRNGMLDEAVLKRSDERLYAAYGQFGAPGVARSTPFRSNGSTGGCAAVALLEECGGIRVRSKAAMIGLH